MNSLIKSAGSFDKVLASCKTIGERFQPVSSSLSIAALSHMQKRLQEKEQAVTIARSSYRLAVNDRRQAFDGLLKLSIRVVRMMAVLDSSEENLQDAIALKNRLLRKSVRVSEHDPEGLKKRRATRNHFQMRMQTFADLVKIVEDVGCYDAHEESLSLPGLRAKLAELQMTTQLVNMTSAQYDSARAEHKEFVFGPAGVAITVRKIKDYLRAAFGYNSAEFSQITKAV